MKRIMAAMLIFWGLGVALIFCSYTKPHAIKLEPAPIAYKPNCIKPTAYTQECSEQIHVLPSRRVDALTNWGQGHAPTPGQCPAGTIEFRTDDNLFLECYRGYVNE